MSTFFAVKYRGASCPIIASTIEEAKTAFNRCNAFVSNSNELRQLFKPVPSHYSIKSKALGSEIKILSSSKLGKQGKGINFCLLDEFCHHHPDFCRAIYNSIWDSLKDKPNAVLFTISTPSHHLTHIAKEKFNHCLNILEGKSDDLSTLPVIYQAKEGWEDDIERGLREALPAIGITTPMADYLEEWKQVKGTVDEPRFLTNNLGLFVSSSEVWIPSTYWESCKEPFKESQFYNGNYDSISAGCDWAASFDVTCYVITVEKNGLFYLIPRFFIPRDCAKEKSERQKVPFLQWSRLPAANLTLTDGDTVDADTVIASLKRDRERFGFRQVRFDPTKMAIVQQMMAREGIEPIQVNTGASTMSPAYELLERHCRDHKIRHQSTPVADWQFFNAKPYKTRGDLLMVKRSAEANSIDFVDATAISLTHWLEKPQEPELHEQQMKQCPLMVW